MFWVLLGVFVDFQIRKEIMVLILNRMTKNVCLYVADKDRKTTLLLPRIVVGVACTPSDIQASMLVNSTIIDQPQLVLQRFPSRRSQAQVYGAGMKSCDPFLLFPGLSSSSDFDNVLSVLL